MSFSRLSEMDSIWFMDTIDLGDLVLTSQEVDSCIRDSAMEFYDTATLRQRINGYDIFFLDRGFQRCVYQDYIYPNPKLVRGQTFTVTINQMENADSAKSAYDASLEYMDTARVISGITNGKAIITQGSCNNECFMYKSRYIINFVGIEYDTTSGAQDAILNKFTEFCHVFNKKLP